MLQNSDRATPPQDQWPIGIAAASDGRLFASYTRGTSAYTLGVVVNQTAEAPFPPSGPVTNLPPDALNTSWHGVDFGVSDEAGLINVQALEITPQTPTRPETLWVLDTGRPTIHDGSGDPSMPYAQPGGPKVVAINITARNDTPYATYTFPPTVHYPDSYMNDLRFDLRGDLSGTSGAGVVYIVDSSDEGRPGFIVLDLGSKCFPPNDKTQPPPPTKAWPHADPPGTAGDSWRRLTQDPSVLRVPWNVPSYTSRPFYYRARGMPVQSLREGLDGVQISPDGATIFYSPLTSTQLYSVPTANLRARDEDPLAELAAHGNVSHRGQHGGDGNGFEGDTTGKVWICQPTENALYYYDPADLQAHGWVRDPRILWPDGASVGFGKFFEMVRGAPASFSFLLGCFGC